MSLLDWSVEQCEETVCISCNVVSTCKLMYRIELKSFLCLLWRKPRSLMDSHCGPFLCTLLPSESQKLSSWATLSISATTALLTSLAFTKPWATFCLSCRSLAGWSCPSKSPHAQTLSSVMFALSVSSLSSVPLPLLFVFDCKVKIQNRFASLSSLFLVDMTSSI